MLQGSLSMGTMLVGGRTRDSELMLMHCCRDLYGYVVRSFSSMCPELPIDIVYTWVNGSDPKLIAELRALHRKMARCI